MRRGIVTKRVFVIPCRVVALLGPERGNGAVPIVARILMVA